MLRKRTKLPFIYRIVKWSTILVVEGLLIMFLFWIYPQKQGVLGEFKKFFFLLVSPPILLYFVFAVLENEAKKAKEFSTIDAMTELYNHRYFFERFEEELKRAKRFSLPFSLLISDVDNFKDYVDNNGHQWADFTLKDLGRLAKKSFRAIDIVGRYGGDEFIYLLPATEIKNATLLIKRVQENIRNYTFQGKTPWHLTLSFGAAGFPGDAQTSEELVRKADEALFLAKETGKNKICIYGT